MDPKIIKHLSSGLRQITQTLNDTIGPLLRRHHEKLLDHDEHISVLYDLHQMNVSVMARAHFDGVFDLPSETEEERLVVLGRLDALQDEYLATLALAYFLGTLGGD